MKTKASTLTPRMLSEFCEKRLAPTMPGEVVKTLHQYMVDLLAREEYPPYRGAGLDLTALAQMLSIDRVLLLAQKAQLRPVFDAIARHVAEARLRSPTRTDCRIACQTASVAGAIQGNSACRAAARSSA